MQHFQPDLSKDFIPADVVPAKLLFSVTGLKSGPKLVVSGPRRMMLALADDLRDLPSLPYLNGEIVLADAATTSTDLHGADDAISVANLERRPAYWTVLARAAQLGIISGRGIPVGWLKS